MIFGYSITSAVAIYFVIWWVVLFAILPIGVRTQDEVGEVTPGTMPSAPHKPLLVRKAMITTCVAAIVFAIFVAITRSGLSIRDIPLPGYGS